jgi:tetratricopeptide (TPR) repeat protein
MKESRGKRRPRRAAADRAKKAADSTAAADKGKRRPNASRFAWIAPTVLLAVVAVGVWYFVFRDERGGEIDDLVAQARAAMGTFEYGRAELLLLDAIALAPANGLLHHNLAITYLRQGRTAEARREFETAITLYSPEANQVRAEENWQLAQLDFTESRWRDAEMHLVRAIIEHPTMELYHQRLIDLQLSALKNQSAADSSTMRFLKFCGPTPENLRDAAHIHFKRKSYSSAIELAREAVAASDTMITAHAILARSYWRTGYLEEALELTDDTLQRYPQATELLVLKGSVLVGLRRPEEALKTLDYALALQPDYYDGHVARMMALFVGGRYDEAIEQARRCSEMTQDENELRFLRGQIDRFQQAQQGLLPADSLTAGSYDTAPGTQP